MMNGLTGAAWRKSSRSGTSNQCVEVATNLVGVVGVRDSKDPRGPVFALAPESFAAFVAAVRDGELRS